MKVVRFDQEESKYSEIVIYGTTVGGKIVYQCLEKRGIKVAFFCDRSEKYKEFCGTPVKKPETLKDQKGYVVINALTRSFMSACQYLAEIGYDKVYSCSSLIEDERAENFTVEENEKVLVEDFLEKYLIYAERENDNEIILPALEVFITERCTLRCRDCSHLIPRYVKPIDYDINEIIGYLKNVLSVVSKISDLIILGGEPLLHKQIDKLLRYCYEEKRIGEITIISNGSVMPEERILQEMKETQTRLRISNYGKYSTRLNEIIEQCKLRSIACYVNDELWTDMGDIYIHNYSEEELKEIFADCPFAFSLLLLRGRLFRCAHVAHLNSLGVINSAEHDSVDVSIVTNENLENKKEEVRRYMQIDFLQGCNYCNGIKNSIQGIEPAIQGIR